MKKKRVLVVGLGHMGMSHALAYARIPDFEVVGLCTRRIADASAAGGARGRGALRRLRRRARRAHAGRRLDQHAARHARRLRDQGDGGRRARVRREAAGADGRERAAGRRHGAAHEAKAGHRLHPPPSSVVDQVRRDRPAAGHAARLPHEPQPAVDRRELGRRTSACSQSFSPIVDCGVHYVDIMCQITPARPTRVHALGARLTDEVSMYNYGMLQVAFDDGSVGWYEAGWGPMMSETAFFVKDVIGPRDRSRS